MHPHEAVVGALLGAFNRRDLDGALAQLHPDIEFHPLTAKAGLVSGPCRGHDEMERYLREVFDVFDVLRIRPASIRAAGDAVAVLGYVEMQGRGGELETTAMWMWKMRDGLVVRGEVFADEREAMRAAGARAAVTI